MPSETPKEVKAQQPNEKAFAASRGSECPVVMVAGLRSILADLSLALVTLKEEGGGCLATKMVINRAITTAHEILGTQNDQALPQGGAKKGNDEH